MPAGIPWFQSTIEVPSQTKTIPFLSQTTNAFVITLSRSLSLVKDPDVNPDVSHGWWRCRCSCGDVLSVASPARDLTFLWWPAVVLHQRTSDVLLKERSTATCDCIPGLCIRSFVSESIGETWSEGNRKRFSARKEARKEHRKTIIKSNENFNILLQSKEQFDRCIGKLIS